METRTEILAWLRERIADGRSGNDGGAFRDGWHAALEWVANELEEEDPPCS